MYFSISSNYTFEEMNGNDNRNDNYEKIILLIFINCIII